MVDRMPGRRWALFFLAFMPLSVMWALVNPMLASPDEQIHIVRAQSLSNGDLTSPYTTDGVPIGAMECFRFQPEVTAACQDLTWGAAGTQYDIPTDDYPALFHAIAAVPALFTSGLMGAYLMRLWLAAVAGAIVAWAGVLVTRPGAGLWPITGLVLAITPMTLFTMSTVNPSGLAVAFTALLATAILDINTSKRTTRIALAGVAVGAVGLATMRRDGLFWLAVVLVSLSPVLASRSFASRLRHPSRRNVAVALAATATLVYVVASWFGPTVVDFLRVRSAGGGQPAWEAARYIRLYLFQAVGTFGWLDSPIGEEAFMVASIAVGALLIIGLAGSNRRLAVSTGLTATALVLSPVVIGMVTFPYLQGRYLLPILACGVIVAGRSAADATTDGELGYRVTRIVLTAWLIVHLVGFVQNLRRYAVGRSGPWRFVVNAEWNPGPMSNLVAVVLFVVAAVNAAVVLGVLCREQRLPRSDFLGEPTRHAVEDRPPEHQADQ